MSQHSSAWVGLDAHKSSIKVAAFFPGQAQLVEWREVPTLEAIRRLARKLQRGAVGPVQCGYEAGLTGYALQRQLRLAGVSCSVIAPSLTPVKPGSRIKTDRRDACKLAEQTAYHPGRRRIRSSWRCSMRRVHWFLALMLLVPTGSSAIQLHWSDRSTALSFTSVPRFSFRRIPPRRCRPRGS